MVRSSMTGAGRNPRHYIVGTLLFLALMLNAAGIFEPHLAHATTIDSGASTSGKPIFKKRKIRIADRIVRVEIADTDERRAYGLMFREKLPQDEGMLFIFDEEEQRSFWMHNTLIPLSIGYFSRDKVLNEILDMQPAVLGASRPKTYPSRKKAMFALEMNIGWYQRNKIRPGVSFRFADN